MELLSIVKWIILHVQFVNNMYNVTLLPNVTSDCDKMKIFKTISHLEWQIFEYGLRYSHSRITNFVSTSSSTCRSFVPFINAATHDIISFKSSSNPTSNTPNKTIFNDNHYFDPPPSRFISILNIVFNIARSDIYDLISQENLQKRLDE